MELYYYHDISVHRQKNELGYDYTPAYLPVMLKNCGFSAAELTPEDLLSDIPGEGDVLLIGAECMTAAQSTALARAIKRGCSIIAFATKAQEVFPSFPTESQGESVYDIMGYFRFLGSHEPLPVLGAFGALPAEVGKPCGQLTTQNGEEYTVFAQIQERVWYWGFDLPATLLYAADGRPTFEGQNGFFLPRIPDGNVMKSNYDSTIAYGDSYMRALEDIISACGFARIYPLPQNNDAVCDMALYFAGDDDATSDENNMRAAAAMYDRGLPYHLNLMPVDEEGHFCISREQFRQLHEQGCETALHYNFAMFPYTEEGHRIQSAMYERAFGEISIGPVNHCLIQVGTAAERYRMEAACGALGDNSRFQNHLDPLDINAFNLNGFVNGSAFPRFVLCDAEHGNSELSFCEVYGSYYEPRIYKDSAEEYEKISSYLDNGFVYGRPLQLFTHPHYISGVIVDAEPALKALDYAVGYVREKGWNVWYCGPDALIRWWHDRAGCSISEVTPKGFTVNIPFDRKTTIVLPEYAEQATVNGKLCEIRLKAVGGRLLKLLNLNPGISRIAFTRTDEQ